MGSGAGLSPVLWASPLLPGRLFQVTKHFCPQLINTHLLKKQTLKWQTTFFIGTSSASPQTASTRHLAWERAKDTSGSLQQNPGRPEHRLRLGLSLSPFSNNVTSRTFNST